MACGDRGTNSSGRLTNNSYLYTLVQSRRFVQFGIMAVASLTN